MRSSWRSCRRRPRYISSTRHGARTRLYIRTRSRATTPCGVVTFTLLRPLPARVARNSRTRTIAARTGHASGSFEVAVSGIRLRGACLPTERPAMLFSEPGSARLCPNTSAVRVAHNAARSLSRRVGIPRRRMPRIIVNLSPDYLRSCIRS